MYPEVLVKLFLEILLTKSLLVHMLSISAISWEACKRISTSLIYVKSLLSLDEILEKSVDNLLAIGLNFL